MRIDRRGFLRALAGALALLSAAARPARAQAAALEVHRSTRNTRLSAIGARHRTLLMAPPLPPFKAYPDLPRVGLPPVPRKPALPLAEALRSYEPARGFDAAPLSLIELGRLLHQANGVTGAWRSGGDTLELRAAPSAGALYAGEVYVVAERVGGLPPGVYYYAVAGHELVKVRPGRFAWELGGAVEHPLVIAGAPAVVLLTNVFERYARRYGNRAYRYALIDSGHIGENLRLAAVSAGLGETGPLRFHDDRLNDLLGLDGRGEAVCAVHAVGRAGAAATAARTRSFIEKQNSASGSPSFSGSVIGRYHEATKLVSGPGAVRPPRAQPPSAGAAEPALVLPRLPAPPAISVEAAIAARRSAREFRTAPIPLAELAFVAEAASGHARLRRAPGVELYLVAHQVTDLPPGLYRYEPREHHLVAIRSGDLRGQMIRVCLGQRKAGRAAVGFIMVARIADSVSRSGDRAYRDLLVEAGAMGQRIYLAAEAVGHAARNLAAFVDAGLNQLLGKDGRREAAIHLTMFGPGA